MIRIIRLGSPRSANERIRIGTVRRPPRGVRKEDFAAKDFYDVWFPNLAPSETLLKETASLEDEAGWKLFKRRFLAEMKEAGPSRDLDLLAALSHHTNFAIGCYCRNEEHCHRAVLRELLMQRDAAISS